MENLLKEFTSSRDSAYARSNLQVEFFVNSPLFLEIAPK